MLRHATELFELFPCVSGYAITKSHHRRPPPLSRGKAREGHTGVCVSGWCKVPSPSPGTPHASGMCCWRCRRCSGGSRHLASPEMGVSSPRRPDARPCMSCQLERQVNNNKDSRHCICGPSRVHCGPRHESSQMTTSKRPFPCEFHL